MMPGMNLADHPGISVDPRVLSGKPAIRGTRVPVFLLVKAVAEGIAPEDVAGPRFWPFLEVEDVLAALAFAAELSQRPILEEAA